MKVVFRVDSSTKIGTGHLTRCLTLAEALRAGSCECHFICREHPGNLIDLVAERGFIVHSLSATDQRNDYDYVFESPKHARWLGVDWQTDVSQVRSIVGEMSVDWVIVDHYAIDERWERELRPVCRKLMVIDDLADRHHDCDILLDQNLVEGWQDRYRGKIPENCGMLLGPDYALLQPIYADLHVQVAPRVGGIKRIFVYFGGADTANLTGKTISAFLSLRADNINLDVVINPASPHAESIRRMAAKDGRVHLHERLPTLAPIMLKADLAIGAGGATSWERCCLGLPTLIVTLAENQKPIASELDRHGLGRWLGCQSDIDEACLSKAMSELLQSRDFQDWSAKCLAIVDGKGCERVASIIMLNPQTIMKVRLALPSDEGLTLRWANDPVTRKNSFHPEIISASCHHDWFARKLDNPESCTIYVFETDGGLPLGLVRFERSNGDWEIHYSLDAYARFRGLGLVMLEKAIAAFSEKNKSKIIGKVQIENIPSRKIFKKLKFHEILNGKLAIYTLINNNLNL